MRLQELFLVETTEEDRAIISLSSEIHRNIQKYADQVDTPSRSYDDYDEYDDDTSDEIDKFDQPILVGKIGDLFDTPLTILNPVTIELQSSDGILDRIEQDEKSEGEVTKGPRGEIMGLWYSDIATMVLNSDYLLSNSLKSTITHELRHALDDYKSDFKANQSNRYTTPKKKSYRKVTNDPYLGNMTYVAQPAEINARFLQVLNAIVPVIRRAAKLPSENSKSSIMTAFDRNMQSYRISELFPEGTKSRDYKRLLKRGMDFIEKEVAHIKSLPSDKD